jgi:hypothetical protein
MSRPVYLYEFAHAGQTIRRAASPRDVLAAGSLWTASAIGHSDIEINGDPERDSVKITLPLSDAYFGPYMRARPDGAVTVTIYKHDRDTSTSEIEWGGRLTAPTANGGELVLRFEPDSTGLASGNRPRIFMRPCPHAHYSPVGCRLNRADFRVSAEIVSVSGPVVRIVMTSSMTDGEFSGGIIEASDGSTRTIKSHVGDTLTLVRKLPRLSADLAASILVDIYPGCDRSQQRCAQFPNPANPSGTNIENHGGFPYMLTGGKNPFGGSSSM